MANNKTKFFYLNGKLHKILRLVKSQDLVECYIFSEKKRVLYSWTSVRKNKRPAWRRKDVARFLDRHPVMISKYLVLEVIPFPEMSHDLTTGVKGDYYWSEDDILRLHDYLLTVHIGRPRADRQITPGKMPSRAELIALMRTDTNMYIRTSDGNYVPVWRAEEW